MQFHLASELSPRGIFEKMCEYKECKINSVWSVGKNKKLTYDYWESQKSTRSFEWLHGNRTKGKHEHMR